MSEPYSFRSAINGFNRTDVVNFIESLCTEHQRALREKTQQLGRVQEERDRLEAGTLELQQTRGRLEARILELEEALRVCESERDELLAAPPAPTVAEAPPAEAEPAAPKPDELELAAYRRAEQAERNAVVRANGIHAQLDAMLAQARAAYDGSCAELDRIGGQITEDLSRMQSVVSQLQSDFGRAQEQFSQMELPELAETEGAE